MSTMTTENITRDSAIAAIRAGLKRRSGKQWSVTGGRGTAWGWITIDAPPARRTWSHRLKAGVTTDRPEDYEPYDCGLPNHSMSPTEQTELATLLGLDRAGCHQGGAEHGVADQHPVHRTLPAAVKADERRQKHQRGQPHLEQFAQDGSGGLP